MAADKTEIFKKLKGILKGCSEGLQVTANEEGKYELYGTKEVTQGKKTVDKMYFGSAVIKKGHVAYYFFPIYTHRMAFGELPEGLGKAMKGKSCFHVKKDDPELLEQIGEMTKKGLEIYKEADWV